MTVLSGTARDGIDFGNFERVVPVPPAPVPSQFGVGGGGSVTVPPAPVPSQFGVGGGGSVTVPPLAGPARPLPLVLPAAFAPAALAPTTEASKRTLLSSTAPARAASVSGIPARLATDDFNRDGVPDIVRATGPGMPNLIQVIDGATGAVLYETQPFEGSFTGGLLVTTGDLTGDGVPDLVVTPDQGGGPRVVVYSGVGFATVLDVLGVDDPDFRGGARPAVGDVNGDGAADLIVAAGFGGGPRVTVWDGAGLRAGARSPLADFFAFEPALRDGAYVATGDVDRDGFADLILGGGPNGGPRVRVVSGRSLLAAGPFADLDGIAGQAVVSDYFAGDPSTRGGVRVAFWDADGDGRGEVVTETGTPAAPDVRSYSTAGLFGNPAAPAVYQDLDTLLDVSLFGAAFVG